MARVSESLSNRTQSEWPDVLSPQSNFLRGQSFYSNIRNDLVIPLNLFKEDSTLLLPNSRRNPPSQHHYEWPLTVSNVPSVDCISADNTSGICSGQKRTKDADFTVRTCPTQVTWSLPIFGIVVKLRNRPSRPNDDASPVPLHHHRSLERMIRLTLCRF